MLHFYKQPLREEKPDLPTDVSSNCNGENVAKKRKLDRDYEDVELNPKVLVEVPCTDRNIVCSAELSLNAANVTSNINRLSELPECESNSMLVAEPSDDVLDDNMSDFDLSLLDDGIEMNSTKSETSPSSRDRQGDLKPVVYSEYMNHTEVVGGEQTVDLETCVNKAALELSIPEDIGSDLFASQSTENVEIYFQSPTVPNFDDKSTAELSIGKTESPAIIHESIAQCDNTNVLSFLNEDVDELENEFNVNLDANGSKSESIAESTSVNKSLNKNLSQATLSQWSKGHVVVEDQLLKVSRGLFTIV